MSFISRGFERLLGRENAADTPDTKLVEAAGYLSIRDEVEVVREPSLNDLDNVFHRLGRDTQEDPAIITLYEAAENGSLPIADVMQYMCAYDMAMHFEYDHDNRVTG